MICRILVLRGRVLNYLMQMGCFTLESYAQELRRFRLTLSQTRPTDVVASSCTLSETNRIQVWE